MSKANGVSKHMVRDCLPSDIAGVVELLDTESQNAWPKSVLCDAIKKNYYLLRVAGLPEAKYLSGFYVAQRVADQLTLMYVAVNHLLRQQGLGKLLMKDLVDMAVKQNCNQVLLELRKSNVAAKNLYTKMGFQQVGIRENYYPPLNSEQNSQREVALLYTLNLT